MGGERPASPAAQGRPAGLGMVVVVTWQAPRIAYELAAEWARVAGRGGAGGPRLAPPAAWKELHLIDQADVLNALTGHARAARALLAQRRLLGSLDVDAVTGAAAAALCGTSRQALWTRLADDPVPATMPECRHCAAITAAALLDVAFRCYTLAGFTPEMIAGHCAAAAARRPPELRLVAQEAS